jgi:hypothetical protein
MEVLFIFLVVGIVGGVVFFTGGPSLAPPDDDDLPSMESPISSTSFRKDIGEPIYFLGERITEEIELFEWATKELDNWGYSLIDHRGMSKSSIFRRSDELYTPYHQCVHVRDIPYGFDWSIYKNCSRYDNEAEYTAAGLTSDEAEYLYKKFEELKLVETDFAVARSQRNNRLKINKSYGLEDPDVYSV